MTLFRPATKSNASSCEPSFQSKKGRGFSQHANWPFLPTQLIRCGTGPLVFENNSSNHNSNNHSSSSSSNLRGNSFENTWRATSAAEAAIRQLHNSDLHRLIVKVLGCLLFSLGKLTGHPVIAVFDGAEHFEEPSWAIFRGLCNLVERQQMWHIKIIVSCALSQCGGKSKGAHDFVHIVPCTIEDHQTCSKAVFILFSRGHMLYRHFPLVLLTTRLRFALVRIALLFYIARESCERTLYKSNIRWLQLSDLSWNGLNRLVETIFDAKQIDISVSSFLWEQTRGNPKVRDPLLN